jgi:antitoxin component of MazEF toxin-antitoxin module
MLVNERKKKMKKTVKVYIGSANNKLITLPKAMLEETKLDKETEVVIENKGGKLIISKKE